MLPSAIAPASAPATSRFSWLNPAPHTIAVYASPWSSPSTAQHSLPGGRYPLPVSPAGPRQLRLAHRYSFIVVDSHHLLLAGLPGAHRNSPHAWAFRPIAQFRPGFGETIAARQPALAETQPESARFGDEIEHGRR